VSEVVEHRALREEEVPPDSDAQSPGRSWLILSLLFAITVINFVDRQTLSVLAPVLRQALSLSNEQYGRIVSALQFGMMSGEFPMGYLKDRWGAQLSLSIAVLWWSTATGAQVFARSGLQFGFIRYWMGTGECGNYSGGMKTVTRFFPKKNRTLAIGIFNSGSMIGSTLAPPLIVFLMQRYGFRSAFLVPACAGICWLPVWWFVYGKERKGAPQADYKISLREMLSTSSSWAVMGCRFFHGPVIQFYWYWIPSYLVAVRHLSMVQVGALAWIPYFMGDAGGIVGGWVAGLLQRRGLSIRNVRRLTMYGSGALCLTSLIVPYASHAAGALLLIGVAILFANFFSANMYAAVTDLFPEQHVGRATGLTGLAGGLSGLLFPLATGWLVDHVSYTPAFIMVAVMPLLGATSLFMIGRHYRCLGSETL
jgi:ACS family hexuronate transporter-like MFS transporter